MSNNIARKIIIDRIKKKFGIDVTITTYFGGHLAFCARNKIVQVEPPIKKIGELDVDGWVVAFKRSKLADPFEIWCDQLESETGDFVCDCVDEEYDALNIDALEMMVWEHSSHLKLSEDMRQRVCKEVVKRHLS